MDYIKFHFKEKYPELEYVSIDSGWDDDGDLVAEEEDAAVAWD